MADHRPRRQAPGPFARLAYALPPRSVIKRYGLALLVVGLTIALRLALHPALGRTGFAIFLTGMLVTAWVGGLGPCLIGQTIILFAEGILYKPDRGVHSPMTLQGLVSLIAFYSVGGIVAVLSEAWHAARLRAAEQQAEALAQREQLLTTLSCIADGVLVTDANGCVVLMNPVAQEMTGWSIDESSGKPVHDLLGFCDHASLDPVEEPVRCVLRDNLPRRDAMSLMASTRKRQRLPVSYSAAPVRDNSGRTTGVVLVFRDETERMRTERALRHADRRKDEFLATLAHELRNPLAPITMGLELMKLTGNESEESEEILAMMERQSRHMVRLIDDLLDVSRITRGKLELRKDNVVLADVVRNAVEAIRPAMEEAEHHLSIALPERPIMLFADGSRLTQVLLNLLSNAAKYTPRGGQIGLSVDARSEGVEIVVSDNGRGVAADDLDAIFDMFMQVRDAKESGHQGLGIGLTLVKQLVEMHGGTVDVESPGTGQGTRFSVRLPVARLKSYGGTNRRGEARASRPGRRLVLVVDDNPDALKALSMLAECMGSEVHKASDGVEAIEAAGRLRPEIVFMDIGMPGMNGFDAAREIRKKPWGSEMTLVATTGWGQDQDIRRTKAAGFDSHLVKPVTRSQLEEVLAASPRGDRSRTMYLDDMQASHAIRR